MKTQKSNSAGAIRLENEQQVKEFWAVQRAKAEKESPEKAKIIDGCEVCSAITSAIINEFETQYIGKNCKSINKLLYFVNIKPKTLTDFLNGKKNLDFFTVCKLCSFLGMTLRFDFGIDKIFGDN